MRLFHKIFLCFVVIFSITFQTAGYLLINHTYGNAISQEKKLAIQNFQYNRYILQSILYSDPEFFFKEETEVENISNSFSVPVAVYGIDGKYFFSNLATQPGELDFVEVDDNRISFRIYEKDGRNYIFVCDYIRQGENAIYLITQTDISSVIDTQKNMIDYFQKIYIVILCISFPMIFLLTNLITTPIKKVRKATKRIAGGRYTERISIKGKDEISELAYDFNQMAGQIEEKITELSDAARQKEDFAANFAHELKTPLTSIIGYADLLRSNRQTEEQQFLCANYIFKEGKRLETLSFRLLDLIVLEKSELQLCKINALDFLQEIQGMLMPVMESKGKNLVVSAEEGTLWGEPELLYSVFINLADNAAKSNATVIVLNGKAMENDYEIEVCDNGQGIPEEELVRITEAFYMVDKSRSRRQGGAGLGLAICQKILDLHEATMNFESRQGEGTRVKIRFPANVGDPEDTLEAEEERS